MTDYSFDYSGKPYIGPDGQCYLRLRTLPTSVDLLSLSIEGIRGHKILYSKSLRFYYIRLPKKITQHIHLRYTVAISPYTLLKNQFIDSLVDKFNVPYAQDNRSRSEKPAKLKDKIIDGFNNPQYYTCAERAAAFYYYYSQHQQRFNENGVTTCLVNDSGTHSWIEVEISGEFYACNLGGAPAESTYVAVKEDAHTLDDTEHTAQDEPQDQNDVLPLGNTEPRPVGSAHRSGQPSTFINDDFDALLSKTSQNSLFVFSSEAQLERARLYIRNKHAASSTLLTADSYQDLQTALPYIHLDTQANTWQPALGPGGLAYNQLSEHTTTHILIDWHDPKQFSARQTARLNTMIDADVSNRAVHGQPIAEHIHVMGLILKDDPRLKDPSFLSRHTGNIHEVNGKLNLVQPSEPVEGDTLEIELYNSNKWISLILGQLLLNSDNTSFAPGPLLQNPNIGTLVLHNPPQNNHAFDRFIQDLTYGHPVRFKDQIIQLNPIKVVLKNGFDYSHRANTIGSVNNNILGNAIPAIIDQVITPSTFERCLYNNNVIDETLIKQPGWIESNAKKDIYLYITRTLSTQQYCSLFDEALAHNKTLHLYLAPGATLPPELDLRQIETVNSQKSVLNTVPGPTLNTEIKEGDILYDVTGRSPDELLYGYTYTFNHDTKKFEFGKIKSALWHALNETPPRRVVLTGSFTPAMCDHLSTLLVPQPYVWDQGQKVYIKGELKIRSDEVIPALSWAGNSHVLITPDTQTATPDNRVINEPSESQTFQETRHLALMSALKDNPMVLAHGLPGTGKSSFVRYLKHKIRDIEVYTENSIEAWASRNPPEGTTALLVFDEATIRNTDWMNFISLNTNSPMLLVRQVEYHLGPRHKIMFMGNLTKKTPKLLQTLPRIEFGPLSNDYIIEKILKPIFSDCSPAIDVEAFYRDNINLSIRALQGKAIDAASKASNPQYTVPVFFENFKPTVAQSELMSSVVDSLNARHFMRQARHESAQFGGQTGIWVEGPAGIGKTQSLHKTLQTLGFVQSSVSALLAFNADDNIEQAYYVIPASCDQKTLITAVRNAFKHGLIVVIDELDTALTDECIAMLNAFLMGEDENLDRPTRPGFTLFATGNGLTYSGRTALPDSLKSRLKLKPLGHHTAEDCRMIFADELENGLDPAWLDKAIRRYHADPVHFTFRDLQHWVEHQPYTFIPAPAPEPTPRFNAKAISIGILIGLGVGLGLAFGPFSLGIFAAALIGAASAIVMTVVIAAYQPDSEQPLTLSQSTEKTPLLPKDTAHRAEGEAGSGLHFQYHPTTLLRKYVGCASSAGTAKPCAKSTSAS